MTYPIKLLGATVAPDGARRIPKFSNTVSTQLRTPELITFISGLGGSYTGYQLSLIEQVWLRLYSAGFLANMELITLPLLTSADSLRNITGGANATNSGASWSIDNGFTTNGSSSFVDFSVNPSTSSKYTQNSNSVGILVADESTLASNTYAVGMSISGTPDITLRSPNRSGDYIEWRAQTTTGSQAPFDSAESAEGFFLSTRTSSTAAKLYKNGISRHSVSSASSSERNGSIVLGRQSSTYAVANSRAFVAGGGLNDDESVLLYQIISEYVARFDESRQAGWT